MGMCRRKEREAIRYEIVSGKGTHSRVREWSCLTLRNKLSEKTHVLTNGFHGKGCPRGEQQGEGTQENCSAMWLPGLGFMVMGLVAGLCLVSHLAWPIFCLTQYPSQLYVHLSAKVKMVKQYYGLESSSSFWCILNYSSLVLVTPPYSLSEPPVLRQHVQVVVIMPGQGRWFLVNSSLTGISPEDIYSKVKNRRSALRRGRRCSFFETESEKNGFCRYNSRQLEFRHEITYVLPKIGDELTCYTKEKKKWEVYRGWLWNHTETSWVQRSSQVPCFLSVGKRLLAFEMFPEFQRADSKSYKLGGWGNAETKGK